MLPVTRLQMRSFTLSLWAIICYSKQSKKLSSFKNAGGSLEYDVEKVLDRKNKKGKFSTRPNGRVILPMRTHDSLPKTLRIPMTRFGFSKSRDDAHLRR